MAARYSQYIKLTHFVGDLFILNLTNVAANYFKFKDVNVFESPKHFFIILINLVWLALVIFIRPYQISRVTQVIRVVRTQSYLIGLHFLFISSFYFFANKIGYSKEYILAFYVFLLVFSVLSKSVFVILIRRFRRKGFNYKKIVIVGFGKLSSELGMFINDHPEYGYKLLGYFGDKENGVELLGNYNDVEPYALKEDIDEIYCCVPVTDNTITGRLVDFGEENLITVKLLTDFREFSFKRMELERYGDFPVINLTSSPLDDGVNKLVKRAFDLAISLFVLVFILSWLTPILALLIKLDSKGKVFFRQERTGIRNTAFICYKFRTMTNGTEPLRATRIGLVLRNLGLDELPQFYNVLIGDMSVVGPRPHMLAHTEEFRTQTDKFMARHAIKPGITGLAQTKGYRGEIKSTKFMQNRVALDRFYIENWSLFLDIKIMLMTVKGVFQEPEISSIN
ncbi:MAG: exopolysaccharide biosynthesis polyprenyl glycosylphosphotransferase [Vicingaceae bacterium]